MSRAARRRTRSRPGRCGSGPPPGRRGPAAAPAATAGTRRRMTPARCRSRGWPGRPWRAPTAAVAAASERAPRTAVWTRNRTSGDSTRRHRGRHGSGHGKPRARAVVRPTATVGAMHKGFVVPYADSRDFADLATFAEEHGWDGIFTWEALWGVDAW